MSNCDNNSLKNVTLKYTSTHQFYTSKSVKSKCYLTSTSIHSDTTSDEFSNTTYEVDVPLIGNYWVDYAGKDGWKYLNSRHNSSTNQTLKQHVQKPNEIFFWKNSFGKSVLCYMPY